MGEERKPADIPVVETTPGYSGTYADEGEIKPQILLVENVGGRPYEIQWPLDPVKEKKLMRKVDWILVPWLFLLFLLAFLDRVNSNIPRKCRLTRKVGNAKIQNLVPDLGLTGNQYNIALLIFFIPYILFEVPSNLIIRKLRPSNWISLIMFVWGIATICQGLCHNFAGLVACRVIIGLAEAG